MELTAEQKLEKKLLRAIAIRAAEIEIQIKYCGFPGPHKLEDAQFINHRESAPWGGGYGDPHDRYGRGNKWGKNKSFNDYRGAL